MDILGNCLLLCVLFFAVSICQDLNNAASNITESSTSDVTSSNNSTDVNGNENHLMRYRKLLMIKVSDINQAVSTVKKMANYEKQYQMLNILMDKIFKVLLEAKVKLTEAGYVPSDGLPVNATVLDAFSLIIENTFFMGRFALELPDQMHELLTKHLEWKVLIQYGIGFCIDSGVLDELDLRILNLAAQELNLITREESYINPNSKKYKLEKQKLSTKESKNNKKMKARKEVKKKGPKLSGPRHSEL